MTVPPTHTPTLPNSTFKTTSKTSSGGTSSASTSPPSGFNLKPADFIQMMVTELQNQDPTQPMKNEELLAQMSQIGQLQSSTTLQQGIQGMVLQNQIGSAGNLIGKSVAGLDDANKPVQGVVNSVAVKDTKVYLNLDSGASLNLGNVTTITPVAPTASGGTTADGTPTAATSTGGTVGATH